MADSQAHSPLAEFSILFPGIIHTQQVTGFGTDLFWGVSILSWENHAGSGCQCSTARARTQLQEHTSASVSSESFLHSSSWLLKVHALWILCLVWKDHSKSMWKTVWENKWNWVISKAWLSLHWREHWGIANLYKTKRSLETICFSLQPFSWYMSPEPSQYFNPDRLPLGFFAPTNHFSGELQWVCMQPRQHFFLNAFLNPILPYMQPAWFESWAWGSNPVE